MPPFVHSSTQVVKRGALEAQLEQDPELSASRRTEKTQAFEARMLKSGLERRLLAAEETHRELERALTESKATIQRLESDRRWLAERELQEREERERLESSWEAERESHSNSIRTLRSSLLGLQATYDDLQDQHASLKRTSASTIATQASNLVALQRRVDMLEQELSQTQSLAQERAKKINALKEQLDDLEAAQDNTSVKLADEQWKIVRDELQRQADQLRTSQTLNARLTSEIQKYRSRNQSIEVLREEKRDLERKLSHLEGIKDRAARLEGELEAARMEREGWVAFLNDPSGEPTSSTPTALTKTLTDLRLINATLAEERGSLKGVLEYRTQQLAEAERRLTDVQAQCAGLKELVEKANERAARRQQKIKLLEMEQASSNALLATFTAEEAIFQEAGTYDAQKVMRIHDLEQILAEYKANNEELRRLVEQAADGESRYGHHTNGSASDLAEVERVAAGERQVRQQLEQELSQVKSKIQEQDRCLEALNQQLWEGGVSITMGQSLPRNTSVLQMQANPASEHFELRRQELNRLKGENLALVRRLRDVETERGIGDSEGLVPRESWDNLNAEKEELLSMIAQKELRLLRLKQVFNAKASEFREAVSSILGYRLAFQSTRVRLTSMFDVTASMVFDSISKAESKGQADVGTMKLISLGDGEAGPPNMRELMQFWVHERNSIPCFLAALTLECYEGMMRTQKTNQTLDSSSMDLDTTNR